MIEEITAISGTRKAIKEMADGTLRIQIDIEPRDKRLFHKLFPDIDMPVAIAPLKPVAEGLQHASTLPGGMNEIKSKYGQQAKELRQSSFFRRPEVWRAVGTDKEFLDWLKTQDCAANRPHSGDVVPAHVRRVGNGSGTGIKPEYSAIPLCDMHHQWQHRGGESAFESREWFDKKRIEYLVKWCWETLKTELSYDSWSNVPPWELLKWAEDHQVSCSGPGGALWMPRCYYDQYSE